MHFIFQHMRHRGCEVLQAPYFAGAPSLSCLLCASRNHRKLDSRLNVIEIIKARSGRKSHMFHPIMLGHALPLYQELIEI